MALSSLLDRVSSALFGGEREPVDSEADRQLIRDLIELVVEAVEPRIRFHPNYQNKLKASVRTGVTFLRTIGHEGLEPVLLTRAAWRDDPRVNTFFAAADDVPACLGRSEELRTFFDDPSNRGTQEAFALLGMKKQERTVLGTELQGDVLRHDVTQVTVSFSGHRVVAPSPTLEATRLEVGRRVVQRLAQVALSRVVALDMKATGLQEHKAYLGARMRMLNLARNGMEGIVKDPADIDAQIKALELELKQTTQGYIEARTSLTTLDSYIQHIDEVFSHPEQHVSLTHTPLRVSRMGVKVDESFIGAVNDLSLAELSIGEDFRGAIAIVRCPRSELPPREDLLAKAERYL